jgi:hypothetical protein
MSYCTSCPEGSVAKNATTCVTAVSGDNPTPCPPAKSKWFGLFGGARVHYDTTFQGVMKWAESELEHIGRIVSLEDPVLQYSYALSTLNGMAYLKDALFQMVHDEAYAHHKKDLLTVHAKVIKAMKHLVKDFKLDVSAIEAFNTKKALSNLSYLKNSNNSTKSNNNNNNNNNTKKVNKTKKNRRT